MNRFLLLLTFMTSSVFMLNAAAASDKADPRAVVECSKGEVTFVQINECLPDGHVAFATTDAVAKAFGASGSELLSGCRKLNDGEIGAAICARSAIQSAISLREKLPENSTINDPLFEALADVAKFGEVKKAEEAAKALFPDKMLWVGGLYHPYRK
jgi:hypothetical protein